MDASSYIALADRAAGGEVSGQRRRISWGQERGPGSGIRHTEWCSRLNNRDSTDRPIGESLFFPAGRIGEKRQIIPETHHEAMGAVKVRRAVSASQVRFIVV